MNASPPPAMSTKSEPSSEIHDPAVLRRTLNHILQTPQFKHLVKAQALAEVKKAITQGKLRPVVPHGHLIPRMDVLDDESSTSIVATFELPGVRAENIKLQLKDGALLLYGERFRRVTSLPSAVQAGLAQQSQGVRKSPPRIRTPSSQPQHYRVRVTHELRYGKFYRGVNLPPGLKRENITARFQEGLLIVTWPRTPQYTKEELSQNARDASPSDSIAVDDDENVGSFGTPVPVTTPVKEESMDLE